MDSINLFMIPNAGSSAMSFMNFKRFLNPNINIYPLEPAGRGKRILEPCFQTVEESAFDLLTKNKDYFQNGEYALFGHSLGTKLAFELTKQIEDLRINPPKHIFFSACSSPDVELRTGNISSLPDDEFIKRFTSLNSSTNQLLQNKPLLNMMIPIFRADVKMAESYLVASDYFRCNCNISVLFGKDDYMTYNHGLSEWQNFTNKDCSFFEFDGGHFYYQDKKSEVCTVINDILLKDMYGLERSKDVINF